MKRQEILEKALQQAAPGAPRIDALNVLAEHLVRRDLARSLQLAEQAFVEAQERKRARRGYSQFVAELVKLGEADTNAFAALLSQIVQVIELHHTNAEKTLLCEEYIDCLGNMCKSASSILCKADWAEDLKSRLAALSAKPRKDVPGLTNKARFALMDLVEFAGRGWK